MYNYALKSAQTGLEKEERGSSIDLDITIVIIIFTSEDWFRRMTNTFIVTIYG